MALAPVAPAHAASSVAAAPMPVACDGPRDLIVERGPVFLRGTRSFDRVCVRDGGTLVVEASLTLRAGILDVAPRGVIDADGEDGYEGDPRGCIGSGVVQPNGARGACAATHLPPHAGVRGPVGAVPSNGALDVDDLPDARANPGDGGGVLTLIARDVALDGQVSARGGTGQAGWYFEDEDGDLVPYGAGGGGSGGGLSWQPWDGGDLRADDTVIELAGDVR